MTSSASATISEARGEDTTPLTASNVLFYAGTQPVENGTISTTPA